MTKFQNYYPASKVKGTILKSCLQRLWESVTLQHIATAVPISLSGSLFARSAIFFWELRSHQTNAFSLRISKFWSTRTRTTWAYLKTSSIRWISDLVSRSFLASSNHSFILWYQTEVHVTYSSGWALCYEFFSLLFPFLCLQHLCANTH